MHGQAIYRRQVYRSKVHPLPRRSPFPFIFPGTEQGQVVTPASTSLRRQAAVRAVHEITRRKEYFPAQLFQRETTVPPPPDSSTHLWAMLKLPRRRPWFHKRGYGPEDFIYGKTLVVPPPPPPVPPFEFDGGIIGKTVLIPTYVGDVELTPTYDSEVDLVLLAGRNSNDVKCTILRQDTGAAIENATLAAYVYDPLGTLIQTVTMTHQGSGSYQGTITTKLTQGVLYTVDIVSSDYPYERIKVETARRPVV